MMVNNPEQFNFIWEGLDKNRQKSKGEITAKSEVLARTELRRQGYRITKISKKSKPLFSRVREITASDIAIFSRQLATLLKAGIPLVQAFDIIGKGHENPSMQFMLLSIKTNLESGDTLAESLKKNPLYFDELFCNLVEAGESAGVLETLLDKIATYKEKTESMKKKIKKALTYPTAVIIVAFIVTTILLLFVVPVFEELFKSFGADLPIFTHLIVDISKTLKQIWWLVLAIIIAAIYSFIYFKRHSRVFNRFLDTTLLKVPVIGSILNKSAIAHFSRTLSILSAAGIPLINALSSVSGTCGNIMYREAVLKIREEVATGQRLQFAMLQTTLFPHMVQQMIAIGEESGSLDAMLAKVADFYEEDVDNLVDNLSNLIEPMIMVILGILIGGLVIAMYLPIFKMGAVIN
jgi:type IV pilus assembly protein PilC